MTFAHDTEMALHSAVSLVNSARPPDTLTSTDELDAFWAEFGYTGRHDGDESELDDVRRLRTPLRELLTSEREHAVTIVNDMFNHVDVIPQLERHDALDWHLHVVGTDRRLAERIAAETAMAMVDVIRANEMSRLGVCARDDCQGLVLDLSRNRRKIFCSGTCGNRNAVAAYRARRR